MPQPNALPIARSAGVWLFAPILAMALLTAACSSSTSTDDTSSSDTSSADSTPDSTVTESTATGAEVEGSEDEVVVGASVSGVPGSAAGEQFEALVTGALEGSLTEEEAEARLSPLFLEQVPTASFIAMSRQLAELLGTSPLVSQISVRTDLALGGTLLNTTDGTSWGFLVNVEVQEPHRVLGYSIVPDPVETSDESIVDLPAAAEAWSALAPRAELLIAEVDGTPNSCENPLATTAGGQALAIGSAFKFYVLAAVATAVDAGEVAWMDELTITDELKSLPSGQLQVEEPGTTLSVATTASLMMGISDNTATDLLIDLVGRPAVEVELEAAGHHRPELNTPFLTTKELFQLKLGDPIRLGLYGVGTEEERRALLDDLASEPLSEIDLGSLTEPTAIDVEWFATPDDMCRVIASLWDRSEDDPDLLAALSAGRGPLEERAWPDAAFKGGSEPGVLSLTWLASRSDGRTFVVSGTLNDSDANIADEAVAPVLTRVFELLAELP